MLFALQLQAQQQQKYTPRAEYDTCHYLQQLEGEWMYVNGQDTIKIYLRFHRDSSARLMYVSDRLVGWHEYKQGNTIVESKYQYRFLPLSWDGDIDDTNENPIYLKLIDCKDTCFKLTGGILDYSQYKERENVEVTLNTTKTVMIWTQKKWAGFGIFTGATSMTLPETFILIKQ